MVKRSLRGLEANDRRGGVAGLEHPYDSFLWEMEEAEEVRSRLGFMISSWSYCCFGGRKTRWTSLLHNSPREHQALHRPRCQCSFSADQPAGAGTNQQGGESPVDAEYPWQLCVAYADAIIADLRALMIPPLGTAQFDLHHLLYNQIMGAARGLQSEDLVYKLVLEVENMVRRMDPGDGQKHLANLAEKQMFRGSDISLSAPKEGNGRGVMTPYPAFRWFWQTVEDHKWPMEQQLSVVHMVMILAELRRRSKSTRHFYKVYVNLMDSSICYWALTKGHSSSSTMNRVLQKIMAVSLATNIQPKLAWTLPKWNP